MSGVRRLLMVLCVVAGLVLLGLPADASVVPVPGSSSGGGDRAGPDGERAAGAAVGFRGE